MCEKPKSLNLLDSLPLYFQLNMGQKSSLAKYISDHRQYTAFFNQNEIIFALKPNKEARESESLVDYLKIKLDGSNSTALIIGENELEGKVNYFIGNDPKSWITDIPIYQKLRYKDIYTGIDLVFYGNSHTSESASENKNTSGILEHDFIIKPGADPQQIKFDFTDADNIEITGQGDLLITKKNNTFTLLKPKAYQEIDNKHIDIPCCYKLADGKYASFTIGDYDNKTPLIIDPVLMYSTYFGGSGSDWASSIAINILGDAYVTGAATSLNLPPVTPSSPFDPYQPFLAGGVDAYVVRIKADGSGIIYFTYLGGSGTDMAFDITVHLDNAVLTGSTSSSNFPVSYAFQPNLKGAQNGFVTKISSGGNLLMFSTYFGGSGTDASNGIAVDNRGDIYITGNTSSPDLIPPNLINKAIQFQLIGAPDAFVAKIKADGSALLYVTYLGGSGYENGMSIAVDQYFQAYITGSTSSYEDMLGSYGFPVYNAIQSELRGTVNAFITKINAEGTRFIYSTYFGGNGGDSGNGIAVDIAERAYITGDTTSTNFPTFRAIQDKLKGAQNAFTARIAPDGTLLFSSYLGGTGTDRGQKIAIDKDFYGYIIGTTTSKNFPVVNPIISTNQGLQDAFVAKINYLESILLFSTYLGGENIDVGNGIAVDPSFGIAYAAGWTQSKKFPVVNPFQPSILGSSDAFVSKIGPGADLKIVKEGPTEDVIVGQEIKYTLYVSNLGPEQADDTIAVDVIPSSVEFVFADITRGSYNYSGGVFTWKIGTMLNKEEALATITVKIVSDVEIANTATISSTAFDPDPNNNKSTLITQVGKIPKAKYSITKSGTPNPVFVGEKLTYTITVRNDGPDTAKSVIANDILPESVKYISSSTSKGYLSNNYRTITWEVGDLADGETATATIIVTPLEEGFIVNECNIYSVTDNPNADSNPFSDEELTFAVYKEADLSIAKYVSYLSKAIYVGDLLQYTLIVNNFGPIEATNVTAVDVLPKDLNFQSAFASKGFVTYANGVLTWQIGNLSDQEAAMCSINTRPTRHGLITNSASVSSDVPDPDMYNNTAVATINILTKTADLSITKVPQRNPVLLGELLTYQLYLTNEGPDTSVGIKVTDTLPPNVTFDSVSISKGAVTVANDVITWEMDYMTYKEIANATISVKPSAIGEYVNKANVTAVTFDPNLINNDVSVAASVITNLSTPPVDLNPEANSLVITAQNTTGDIQKIDIIINYLTGTITESVIIQEMIDPGAAKYFIINKPSDRFEVVFRNVPKGLYFWVAARYENADAPLSSSNFIYENTYYYTRLVNVNN